MNTEELELAMYQLELKEEEERAREYEYMIQEAKHIIKTELGIDIEKVYQDVWRDIESAPKDGTTIVVGYYHLNPNIGFETDKAYFNCTKGTWELYGGYTQKPTHWIPLPPLED